MAITDIIEETELTAGAPSIKYEGDMNPDQGSGIMQMASMESGQEGTLEEIYFELIADGMDPEAASIKAREIYNNMSSQPQDMMQEPRTMAADGGVIMQGGVKNYLPSKEVTVPKKAKSSKNHPTTELAYITEAEKNLLLKKDLHNSLNGKPNKGPGGIISLNGEFDGGPDRSPGNTGSTPSTGGGGNNFRQTSNITNTTGGPRATGPSYSVATDAQGNPFTGGSGSGGGNDPEDKPAKDIQDFLDKKADIPKYVPSWMKLAANFNRGPNRKFFLEKVMRGKNYDYQDIYDEDFDLEQAYQDYMSGRMSGATDAYGNPAAPMGGGGGEENFKIATAPDDSDEEEAEEEEPFQLGLAFRADGGRVGKAYGGSMGDDGRRAYGLGSIFKKIKKVFKSPLGKAALIGLGGYGLSGGLGGTSFMQGLKSQGLSGILKKAGGYALKNPGTIIPLASAAGALFTEEDEEEDKYVDNTGFDPDEVRENYLKYLPRANRAEGGPMGGEIMEGESEELLDMNGMEKDYREDGGFVPIGEYEKKDDVPARLSKNEFVFTADAVRGAGEGDVDLGAEKLYTQMKELESVGKRMQGANEMFQTSQRLEEVV
jgi:hypothetical protein